MIVKPKGVILDEAWNIFIILKYLIINYLLFARGKMVTVSGEIGQNLY